MGCSTTTNQYFITEERDAGKDAPPQVFPHDSASLDAPTALQVPDGSDPSAAFVGNRVFAPGAYTPMCGGLGASIAPIDMTGDTMAIPSVDATHLASIIKGPGLDCSINFVVTAEGVATPDVGQTCQVTMSVGGQSQASVFIIMTGTLSANALSLGGTANDVISSEFFPTRRPFFCNSRWTRGLP